MNCNRTQKTSQWDRKIGARSRAQSETFAPENSPRKAHFCSMSYENFCFEISGKFIKIFGPEMEQLRDARDDIFMNSCTQCSIYRAEKHHAQSNTGMLDSNIPRKMQDFSLSSVLFPKYTSVP